MIAPRSGVGRAGRLAALCCLLSSARPIQSHHQVTSGAQLSTLRVVDHAIRALYGRSADTRRVLEQASAALPPDSDDRARREIHRFIDRMPGQGADFRCDAEFIRVRARDVLWRLRDWLTTGTPPPMQPAVCYAAPFAVDAAQPPRSGVIDIYGYDLDATPLQLVLVRGDGFDDVSGAVRVSTHYHVTARIGEGGAVLNATSRSLGLSWGHVIRYSIPILQFGTALCDARVENVPPGQTISYLLPKALDTGMDRQTRLWGNVSLDADGNAVTATMCVAGDASLAGCSAGFVFATDPDRVVDAIVGPATTDAVDLGPIRSDGTMMRATAKNLVEKWNIDWTTPDAGSVTATFGGLRVITSPRDGCVSPTAYVEATRTHSVGPSTAHALRRQLEALDPLIVRARPRFAPQRF